MEIEEIKMKHYVPTKKDIGQLVEALSRRMRDRSDQLRESRATVPCINADIDRRFRAAGLVQNNYVFVEGGYNGEDDHYFVDGTGQLYGKLTLVYGPLVEDALSLFGFIQSIEGIRVRHVSHEAVQRYSRSDAKRLEEKEKSESQSYMSYGDAIRLAIRSLGEEK